MEYDYVFGGVQWEPIEFDVTAADQKQHAVWLVDHLASCESTSCLYKTVNRHIVL